MILSNIKQFLTKNKKILYYLGFFLVIFLISSEVTFAEAVATDTQSATNATTQRITSIASAILGGLGLLLGFATYLATLFLSPEWINGTLFGLDSKFKEIWILVSNIVYFIFAFILIWIAFMNIIGKSSDQYQLKQALPKFIVGVLIVPFSWFLVQFILSISSILTVAALSLPTETFSQYASKIEKVTPPKFCTIDLNSFSFSKESKTKEIKTGDTDETKTIENKNAGWIYCTDDKDSENSDSTTAVKSNNNDTAINSIFKIIGLYTYGILSFDSMDELINNFEDDQKVKTLGNIAVQVFFDLLFVIIYSILIITLAMVLLIRGIYIWIYIMISPIFGLMYFFDKKDGAGEGFFSKFNIKEFIALAMVPVYTMLALSFGLLFIYIVGEGLVDKGSSTGQLDGKAVTINDKGNILTIDGFQLEIIGNIGSSQGKDIAGFYKAMGTEGGNVLGVIGTLILKVFGIVVLWGALMAAMRTSEITKAITEPIHQFGTKVGQIAGSTPGNIPIFGGKSATELSSAAGSFKGSIDSHYSSKGTEWGQSLSPFAETEASKLRLINAEHSVVTTKDQGLRYIDKMGGEINNLNKTLMNDSSRKQFMEMIQKVFGDKVYEGVKDSQNSQIFYSDFKKVEAQATGVGGSILNGGLQGKNKTGFIEFFEKGSASNGDSGKPTNSHSTNKPSLDESGVNDVLIFGTSKLKVKIEEGKIVDLLETKNDLASYIAKELLNTKQLEELVQDLNLSNKALEQLNAYFKKDNSFKRTGGGDGTVKAFAESNDPKKPS